MRDAYRQFCGVESSVPLFSQDWWLDVVAGQEGWNAALVEKGGLVVAALPYTLGRKLFFHVSTQPPLTQSLGPWLSPSSAKRSKALARQKALMDALIDQLPQFDHFQQNWHPSQTNWLPFRWHGFEQTTRYSYAITGLQNMDEVWSGFDQNIRTDIRKAQERFGLRVRTDLPLDTFLGLHKMVFGRQGKVLPYPEDLVRRLHTACVERDCCRVLVAEDGEGRLHAGAFIVWDQETAYYLMGGSDPSLRNSGATSLCLWEAIQLAATVTQRFDFEGSMLEPIERFFRAFGAEQVPYFQVKRTRSRIWRTLSFVRSLATRSP